jgi:hypothetical protein
LHALGRNAPRHEGKQAQAHLVCPVHILEHHDDELRSGDMFEEPGHALEEAQGIVAGRRQAGSRDFRKEAGQFRAPSWIKRSEGALVREEVAGPDGVDPGAEGQDLGALVAPAATSSRNHRGSPAGRWSRNPQVNALQTASAFALTLTGTHAARCAARHGVCDQTSPIAEVAECCRPLV